MLHVIRQILVQITQTVRISREHLILPTQPITSRESAEPVQINNVQRGDMVGFAAEEVLPVALLPEAEAFHFGAGVAHGREAVGRALEVVGDEVVHVCADDLVCVDEDDFVQGEGEEDVEEEDLVAPDFALLFFLGAEPVRPLVGDHFVGEVVFGAQEWGGRRGRKVRGIVR